MVGLINSAKLQQLREIAQRGVPEEYIIPKRKMLAGSGPTTLKYQLLER
ncbi:MAG: hypothetical protein LVQ95_03795 [Candidatus Micrarchaeales archaeon]|nr:hypothetical protein [Candidatus Micrarchaeales archaeon]